MKLTIGIILMLPFLVLVFMGVVLVVSKNIQDDPALLIPVCLAALALLGVAIIGGVL